MDVNWADSFFFQVLCLKPPGGSPFQGGRFEKIERGNNKKSQSAAIVDEGEASQHVGWSSTRPRLVSSASASNMADAPGHR
jgi:hypothetical protein